MSTAEEKAEEELRNTVGNFLRRNFPQIAMHGGNAAIVGLDTYEKSVSIQLGGACSGCGISPMTIMAIKNRLTSEVDEIDLVHVETGLDDWQGGPSESRDAPF